MAFSSKRFAPRPAELYDGDWACSDGIGHLLHYYLDGVDDKHSVAHIISPNLSSVYTPLKDAEGIKNYAEKIAGYFAMEDGDLVENGFIHQDGGTLAKPIVMVINTHTAKAKSKSDVNANGGLHWVCAVVLPKSYTILGQTFTHTTERVFYFDSALMTSLPDKFFAALKDGYEFREIREAGPKEIAKDASLKKKGVLQSTLIPAAFPELEIVKSKPTRQQLGGSDCGWWAVYNALMTVLTGGDAFMKQFDSPYKPQRAYPLIKMFPTLPIERKLQPDQTGKAFELLGAYLKQFSFPPEPVKLPEEPKPEKKFERRPPVPTKKASVAPVKKEMKVEPEEPKGKTTAVEIELPKGARKPNWLRDDRKDREEKEEGLINLDDVPDEAPYIDPNVSEDEFGDFNVNTVDTKDDEDVLSEDMMKQLEAQGVDPRDLAYMKMEKETAAKLEEQTKEEIAVTSEKKGDDRDISEVDMSELQEDLEVIEDLDEEMIEVVEEDDAPSLQDAQRELQAAEAKVADGIAQIYQSILPSKQPVQAALFDSQGILTKEISAEEIKSLKLDQYFTLGMSAGVTVVVYHKDAADHPPIAFTGEQLIKVLCDAACAIESKTAMGRKVAPQLTSEVIQKIKRKHIGKLLEMCKHISYDENNVPQGVDKLLDETANRLAKELFATARLTMRDIVYNEPNKALYEKKRLSAGDKIHHDLGDEGKESNITYDSFLDQLGFEASQRRSSQCGLLSIDDKTGRFSFDEIFPWTISSHYQNFHVSPANFGIAYDGVFDEHRQNAKITSRLFHHAELSPVQHISAYPETFDEKLPTREVIDTCRRIMGIVQVMARLRLHGRTDAEKTLPLEINWVYQLLSNH
jgi:hypothetical protein